MTNHLNDLRKIKISSSFEFCHQALSYLQNHIQSSRISDPNKFLEDLNQQGKTIVKMQPNMASLKKKIAMVIYIFKRAVKTKKSSEEIKKSVVEKIQDLIDLANQKQEKIAAIGSKLIAGKPCGLVESVKTGSDLHAPVDGEVIEVNQALINTPELINEKPYQAWIFKYKPSAANDKADIENKLLSAEAYQVLIDGL